MKTSIQAMFITFTLFFCTLSQAGDLKDGFMGYQWGEHISQYDQFTELYTKGDVTYYSNPGEAFTIEEIIINNVVFGFYKRRLFAVYIGIDSLEKYDSIRQYLQSKYGLPGTKASAKEYLTTYKWKYEDVTIKLKTDQIGGKMKLACYYRPLSSELNKQQIEEISEKSYKFFPIDKNKTPKLIPFLEF